ncbi:MAG: hypothetical protein ABIJ97_02105 [Bacteroidota bacterium]
MNKQLLLIFYEVLMFSITFGQSNLIESQNISQFIPKDYSILNLTKGDLNLDSIADIILVLNLNGEDSLSSIENPVKRKFLILIGQADNSYILFNQNDNIVYFYGYDLNFKEAFVDIIIGKGIFSIDHYGGFTYRWGRSTAFSYDASENNWFLSMDNYSTFNVTDLDEQGTEKLINTKNYNKLSFDKFDIYKDW